MEQFLHGVAIFVFILSLLNVLKNIFSFIKTYRLAKQGKEATFNNAMVDNIILASSISYIITFLIV
jgi:hypothetical protein